MAPSPKPESKKALQLPLTVVGRSDLQRMLREIERLDDFFVSAASRKSGTPIQPPRITRMLDEVARNNGFNLLEAGHRKDFATALKDLLNSAPSLHISFASEPSPRALERILSWFRDNIHPQALLQVGLQPSIAAGCVLRTPNQMFDMSIGARLKTQEEYLAKLIGGSVNVRK